MKDYIKEEFVKLFSMNPYEIYNSYCPLYYKIQNKFNLNDKILFHITEIYIDELCHEKPEIKKIYDIFHECLDEYHSTEEYSKHNYQDVYRHFNNIFIPKIRIEKIKNFY